MQRLYTIYVAAVTLLLVLPLAGCGVDSSVTAVPQNKLHLTDDYVLAARFSPQLHDIGRGAAEGYVLLAREDRVADIVNVGYMDNGQLVWSDEGLFFGGMTVEYHLDNKGLKSYPRGADEEFETSRFPGTKENKYISIYNVGILPDGFANRVVTGIGKQLRHWEVPGLLTSIAKCDDGVVAMAQGKELNSVTRSILRNPNNSTVLLKLYPKPQDLAASVLGEIENDESYEYSQYMEQAPCVNGFMYTLATRKPVDYSNEGTQVLREWNIYDGSYREFPLVLEDGKPAHVKGNDIEALDGGLSLDKKTYYWVSWKDGKLRSVDLTTRVVKEVLTLKLSQFDGNMRCIVAGNFLFVLDEFPKSDRLRFSRYNIKTGEKTDYFDIKGILKVDKNRMFRNELRGIAINPNWLKKHTLPQD
ncbi:hypothetical protein [Mobiluncus mulieris]|uniref:hypothetical protein n=1 Tax=Mobiluncus mulieris TaxID=2052 RepID=UPI0021E26BAD|nr:hypothetical protein [Mobiluncus mulieris]MCV0010249.1 hypothetical protein [Mobiluncus mulieris]